MIHPSIEKHRTAQLGAAVLLVLLAAAGCQKSSPPAQQPVNTSTNTPPASNPPDQAMNQSPPSETSNPGEPKPTIPAETAKPKPPKPKPPAPKPEAPPAQVMVTVPAGTMIKASLRNTLRSDTSAAGTPISLTVIDPVVVDGKTVIPAGATVGGKVASSQGAGKVSGRGEITLYFESVTDAAGATRKIVTEPFFAKAESGTGGDVAKVAGGAAAGAVIGGIIGGKKGAGIGGLIGAAAGTGTVLATKGPEVKLAEGQLFEIKLNEPVELPAPKG